MRRTAPSCVIAFLAGLASAHAGGDIVFIEPEPRPTRDVIGQLIDDLFAPAPAPDPRRPESRRAVTAAPASPSPQGRGPKPGATSAKTAIPPLPAAASPMPPPATPTVAPPEPLPERPARPPDVYTRAGAAITTGTLQTPSPSPADEPIVGLSDEAERLAARADIIKLELAGRAYNEPRLSGQPVFETRPYWRVLERARDALSESELSAAQAVGFEANAYINERDKLIVVGVAGTQDLRRDFLTANVWDALIRAQAPQQFHFAKMYISSVMKRYQAARFSTECVGHSLGGGACAYAAAELGIRATVVNPISAGPLSAPGSRFVMNYIVDGDIAQRVYTWRGNMISSDVRLIDAGRDDIRRRIHERYGALAGPIRVAQDLKDAVRVHSLDKALDLIAAQSGGERVR
jgi:hypothetical protein